MAIKHIIYALTDPETADVRYIGRSSSGMKRPLSYNVDSMARNKDGSWKRNTRVFHWVRSVLARGMKVDCVVLEYRPPEIVDKNETNKWLDDHEKKAISHYRGIFARLTNLTDGGEGITGCSATPERKAKIGAANKGKRRSSEQKALMSASAKIRCNDPEYRKKISAAHKGLPSPMKGKKTGRPGWNKGVPCLDHVKKASSIAHLGISPANKGVPATQEQKDKRAAAMRKHYDNPEYIAKMSLAGKKKWEDPEYHARMCKIQKAAQSTPEVLLKKSQSHLGQKGWNKGISPSKETRALISKTLKERNELKRQSDRTSAEECSKCL